MPVLAKRRKRLILWSTAVFVACFVFVLVDSMGLTFLLVRVAGDAMDWKSHYLAGFGSVDCGRVKVRGDASGATQCALQADGKAKPFHVVYDIQGIDSIVAGGIVRTHSGQLLALSNDSCPSGCGSSLLQQRVSVTPCPQPYHLYVNPRGRLNCFQAQLSPPKSIMSPNSEAY